MVKVRLQPPLFPRAKRPGDVPLSSQQLLAFSNSLLCGSCRWQQTANRQTVAGIRPYARRNTFSFGIVVHFHRGASAMVTLHLILSGESVVCCHTRQHFFRRRVRKAKPPSPLTQGYRYIMDYRKVQKRRRNMGREHL